MPTIAPEDRAFCERLASLSGWDVAKELGLSYFGDANPIRHGGVFYNPNRWDDWGYAPAIEFWWDADADRLAVSRGSINRRTGNDLLSAFRACDCPPEHQADPHSQIQALLFHWGIECDPDTPGPRYNLDTWAEWRLWRSVLPMLRSIRDEV